jgi:hypothetical protein
VIVIAGRYFKKTNKNYTNQGNEKNKIKKGEEE